MKKIGNSFVGVIFGFILLIAGTILLWWNEGNNVRNLKTTDEIAKELIDVSSENVDSENEGKLVATNGKIVLSGEVNDYLFKVKAETAMLKRKVEMYQWIEEEETDNDGNKTYHYKKEWKEELIDSSNYNQTGHQNPASMSYKSDSFAATSVHIGAFALSNDQISNLDASRVVYLNGVEPLSGMRIVDNYMTNASDLNNPQVGNYRISWTYNDWEEASVLAKQKGNTFENYVSKSDKTVNRVEKGILSGEEIVNIMKEENKILKWVLRGAGFLLILIGYLAVLGPLSTIASFIPFLGTIVGGVLGIVGFLIGLVHSLIVIAIAWIRFRPIVGISLLAIALLLFLLARGAAKKSKN